MRDLCPDVLVPAMMLSVTCCYRRVVPALLRETDGPPRFNRETYPHAHLVLLEYYARQAIKGRPAKALPGRTFAPITQFELFFGPIERAK